MDFKCKCGGEAFFIKSKGSQVGLYCSVCGKWQKWLTKKEVRQFEHESITHDTYKDNQEDDGIVYENIDPEEDEKFVLSPWGCLHCAFNDFGLHLPEISGKMADALMNDFFEIMEHAGIVEKKSET